MQNNFQKGIIRGHANKPTECHIGHGFIGDGLLSYLPIDWVRCSYIKKNTKDIDIYVYNIGVDIGVLIRDGVIKCATPYKYSTL